MLRKIRLRNQPPAILIESSSPTSPITAFVEQDNRVVYFYLQGADAINFGVRACWVRNLAAAPPALDRQGMADGKAPLQPREHCNHPASSVPLRADHLSIVWLPEGNAAALLENGEVLAIIPGWSGMGDFRGYARDAVGSGPLATELRSDMDILHRVTSAQALWDTWENADPFTDCQARQMKSYEAAFGPCTQYYAIDGGQFPPRGLYTHRDGQRFVAITVGMSLLPMPVAEMYAEGKNKPDRIEVGIVLNDSLDVQQAQTIANSLSGLAALPWSQVTWLGEGHTVSFSLGEGVRFDNVLLTSRLSGLPQLELTPVHDEQVRMLWLIPIHQTERQAFHTRGDGTLVERLGALGPQAFSLERKLLG